MKNIFYAIILIFSISCSEDVTKCNCQVDEYTRKSSLQWHLSSSYTVTDVDCTDDGEEYYVFADGSELKIFTDCD